MRAARKMSRRTDTALPGGVARRVCQLCRQSTSNQGGISETGDRKVNSLFDRIQRARDQILRAQRDVADADIERPHMTLHRVEAFRKMALDRLDIAIWILTEALKEVA